MPRWVSSYRRMDAARRNGTSTHRSIGPRSTAWAGLEGVAPGTRPSAFLMTISCKLARERLPGRLEPCEGNCQSRKDDGRAEFLNALKSHACDRIAKPTTGPRPHVTLSRHGHAAMGMNNRMQKAWLRALLPNSPTHRLGAQRPVRAVLPNLDPGISGDGHDKGLVTR